MDNTEKKILSVEEIENLVPKKTSAYPDYYPTEDSDPDPDDKPDKKPKADAGA